MSGGSSAEGLSSVPPGTRIRVTKPGGSVYEGWLLPVGSEFSRGVIFLKLPSGYNIGVHVLPGTRWETLPGPLWGRPSAEDAAPATPGGDVPGGMGSVAGSVVVLTTGGPLASRIDYVTGGVRPVLTREALAEVYPGLYDGGPVMVREVFQLLSEDMGPKEWVRLSEEVERAFREGCRGVVIAHGTDTLSYTAASLAFQFERLPGPVVLVGAQRSIDRPSSDGVLNLLSAVRLAREADVGEVLVVMHETLDDDRVAIHRATRVRKMHSTRRDAFQTRNGPPLGYLDMQGIHWQGIPRPRDPSPALRLPGSSPDARLIWMYPGLTPETLDSFAGGSRGVIIAGTGLGHVSRPVLDWVRKATSQGLIVGMTTQCLEGVVDPFVYARGRELEEAGVVYLEDMLPEVAFVKLAWCLAQSSDPREVRRLLQTNLRGEMEARRPAVRGAGP